MSVSDFPQRRGRGLPTASTTPLPPAGGKGSPSGTLQAGQSCARASRVRAGSVYPATLGQCDLTSHSLLSWRAGPERSISAAAWRLASAPGDLAQRAGLRAHELELVRAGTALRVRAGV